MKMKFTAAQLRSMRKKLNAAHREADRIEGLICAECRRVEDKLDKLGEIPGARYGMLYQALDKYETKLHNILD